MSERVLLDTHALIWAVFEPDRLGSSSRALLARREVHLAVSAASAWELGIKHALGKLTGAGPLVRGFEDHLRRLGAHELAITAQHGLLAGGLDWPHKDPFDRLLVAQAQLEGLTLVTSDRALRAYPGVHTLW